MTHKRTSKGPQEGGGTPTHWVAVDPHPAVDDPGAVGHGAQSTEDVAVPLSLQREPGLRWARLRAEDESRGAQPLSPRGTWRGGQAAKGPRGPRLREPPGTHTGPEGEESHCPRPICFAKCAPL